MSNNHFDEQIQALSDEELQTQLLMLRQGAERDKARAHLAARRQLFLSAQRHYAAAKEIGNREEIERCKAQLYSFREALREAKTSIIELELRARKG